eukprot:2302519-Prymnesium_polylepis.1
MVAWIHDDCRLKRPRFHRGRTTRFLVRCGDTPPFTGYKTGRRVTWAAQGDYLLDLSTTPT